MSWMDFGDVRKARGGTPTGKNRGKQQQGWISGEQALSDAKLDRRAHNKAMEKQRRKEAEAQEVEKVRQRAKKAQAEEKYKKKQAKKAKKEAKGI